MEDQLELNLMIPKEEFRVLKDLSETTGFSLNGVIRRGILLQRIIMNELSSEAEIKIHRSNGEIANFELKNRLDDTGT